jgi:molecular chaperone HtpG
MADTSSVSEHRFQAEVNQVLDIVINSLYSNREIFLRELISNAADALDKLRFLSVTRPELLGAEKNLEIQIVPDQEAKSLSLIDTGIGMTREELIENLGTIAHSGSKKFLERAKESSGESNVDLIGRFGVGFYSAFLVSKRVQVRTLSAEGGEGLRWSSEANGVFTIEPDAEWTTRGTEITLFLKDDQEEYLEEYRLRELVRRYSDFVSWPILLEVERSEGEGDERKTVRKDERINQASALWRRPRKDVKEEDYQEFYRHLTYDSGKPLDTIHFSIEGTNSFTGLLFIPREAPFDLYDRDRKRGVRLYVKRVLIMEHCEDLVPEYLRFVRGLLDSDDLPLNVSRELLQENRVVKSMRKTLTAKVLAALEYMAKEQPDDYSAFWTAFGKVFKEGLHFDHENREKLAELVRYESSNGTTTSLKDYRSRMPEDQDAIYYAIASNRSNAEGSPHIEGLRARGFEVLYMTDPVDEWAVMGIPEYDGKKLVSAMKANLPLKPEDQAAQEAAQENLSELTGRAKEVLKDLVSEVVLSTRLKDSPACLVVPEHGVHSHIERMLRAQGNEMPTQKPILELNPTHPIVEKLKRLHAADHLSSDVADWLLLLHDQATLAEGSPITDPAGFAKRMTRLMGQALGN